MIKYFINLHRACYVLFYFMPPKKEKTFDISLNKTDGPSPVAVKEKENEIFLQKQLCEEILSYHMAIIEYQSLEKKIVKKKKEMESLEEKKIELHDYINCIKSFLKNLEIDNIMKTQKFLSLDLIKEKEPNTKEMIILKSYKEEDEKSQSTSVGDINSSKSRDRTYSESSSSSLITKNKMWI
jgi:hypothetical protein